MAAMLFLSAAATPCAVLALPRRVGEPVAAADLRPAACSDARPAPLRRDRASGEVRAARDLPAGAYLGRLALAETPAVARGAALRLVSRVGPVAIERAVTALQPGRAGRRVFVRDADGQVFAVRVAADAGDAR